MKKLKNFLLLCLVAVISTGCVKYNGLLEIKKDKSMNFTIIYALDKSLMSMGGESEGLKEEEFDELKKAGFKVEKYSEGNYEGFKITRKINNIDEVSTTEDVIYDLSGMMEPNDDNKYMFKVVKGDEKNTYYAKFKFESDSSSLDSDDLKEDENNQEESILPDEDNDILTTTGENDDLTIGSSDSNMDLSGLANSMDLSFQVILPNSAISSNATTKENNNKNLTWKLNATGSQTLEFAFELSDSNSNMLLYIGIGIGVLLILVLIFLLTRKKGKKEVAPVNENRVEINNDVNEAIQEQPEVKKEVQVVNEIEQKDA